MSTPPLVKDSVSIKSLLFATDFSAASLQALPYATGITRRFVSKLYIAHIVPPEDYASDLQSLEEAAQVSCREAQRKLSSLADLDIFHDLLCETFVGHGDIWIGLNDFMRKHVVELLVMGTTGRSGVKKFLLGSVAEEAMREARCPVLTLGPESRTVKYHGFRQIVYATDFSMESLAALPYAISFSMKYTSRLILVNALQGLPDSPHFNAQMAKVRLRELIAAQGDFAPESKVLVEMGAPAEAILRVADAAASDMIVIGARGAGSLARVASHFGSVAHKVVCSAVCPVLTVRGSTAGGGNRQ